MTKQCTGENRQFGISMVNYSDSEPAICKLCMPYISLHINFIEFGHFFFNVQNSK